MDITIVQCTVEADQEIAIACAAGNEGLMIGEETFFCLANDRSAMNDMNYELNSSLTILSLQ